MLLIITVVICWYAECRYAKCRLPVSVIMLSVVILSVIMLSVIIFIVVMLSVVVEPLGQARTLDPLFVPLTRSVLYQLGYCLLDIFKV